MVHLHRRGLIAAVVGALAAGPAWAQAPKIEERVVEGIAFLRGAVPPAVMQDVLEYKTAAAVDQPVMEQSDAREIRDFREFLDRTVARERSPVRKLELVNVYVNTHAKQIPDERLYLRKDLWAPPLNTLLIGGDCEDFVLLKAWALRRLGFDERNTYLVAGVSRTSGQPVFHAVLVVLFRPNHGVLLDSLSNPLHRTKESAKFEPTYALNKYGFWTVAKPNPEDKRFVDDLARQSEPTRLPSPVPH